MSAKHGILHTVVAAILVVVSHLVGYFLAERGHRAARDAESTIGQLADHLGHLGDGIQDVQDGLAGITSSIDGMQAAVRGDANRAGQAAERDHSILESIDGSADGFDRLEHIGKELARRLAECRAATGSGAMGNPGSDSGSVRPGDGVE